MTLRLELQWATYCRLLRDLPYGKSLPTAFYLHRQTPVCQAGDLAVLLSAIAKANAIDEEFNIVKFRTDAPRVSFLAYPEFDREAHPALKKAVAIDLTSGRSYATSYRDNLNPPILHRKELLLAPPHPSIPVFAALSAAEERAGLYENVSTIGFRLNWERLLRRQGVVIEGHSLRQAEPLNESFQVSVPSSLEGTPVRRHRTALTRYTLSKPVKSVLEFDQLAPGSSFFDYGCGLGDDVRGLCELGYDATGWDPVHAPAVRRQAADTVNLGYVLNVIEDPAERLEALVEAWQLANRLLVVSALIGEPTQVAPESFQDGVLTRRQTFQKYFTQQELQRFIEDALETPAVAAALGVFYVFRDPGEHQLFVELRSRRTIDWSTLTVRTPSIPAARVNGTSSTPRRRPDRFEEHGDLIDSFWTSLLTLGRLPVAGEYERLVEIGALFGSPKRALRYLLDRGRREAFETAEATRKNDLLVYLASANLRNHIPLGRLPAGIREDISTFFGNYKTALKEGLLLLKSAADPNTIILACDDTTLGWQDERSLYIHPSLVDRLPVVLRSYILCAELLFGDIGQADLIKLHKHSGKVTFLAYEDFDSTPLPFLVTRTKVNLRNGTVDSYDHRDQGQVLCFKERYLDPDHPRRGDMLTVSDTMREVGVSEASFMGPTAPEVLSMLRRAGKAALAETLFPPNSAAYNSE